MSATEILTDVTSLIAGAFDEMECVIEGSEHSGGQAAYYVAHGCISGMICAGHLKMFVDSFLPRMMEMLKKDGAFDCSLCRQLFTDPDSFAKVYTL